MDTIITTALSSNIYFSFIYSLLVGLVILGVYSYVHKNIKKGFLFTLLLLPIIISTIIIIMGDNVAGAFSLAGIFSIVRFRSTPGDVEEITYILYTVALGLFSAVGMYLEGIIFLVIVCIITIAFYYNERKRSRAQLTILIPEDINYHNLVDDIFNNYCSEYNLTEMNTKDLGSLYELRYSIVLKEASNIQQMLDEIRVRNGNLNINLTK